LKGDSSQICGPQLQTKYFLSDSEVQERIHELGPGYDPAVASSSTQSMNNTDRDACGKIFKAGNPTRTSGRGKAFDTTGVVGTVCRHGTPFFFLDIKGTGEKMVYALVLLAKLLEIVGQRIVYFYDIGCIFKKYMQVCNFFVYRL
jgi:hypothetical protein